MLQFSDHELVNEQLVLDSKTELYYLGHDLTLRQCTLVLKVPARALVITRTRLIDCTIQVQQELKNFRWYKNFLKGCRFTGRLSGNDFGLNPDPPPEGGIEDCDFSAAQLDGCRFLACDTTTLRFPTWPCFTLLDPVRRARELGAAPWPGRIGRVVMSGFEEIPSTTMAVTYSAPALAKRYDTTPEAIKATLKGLDGVMY
jgi:hypothetical protein